MNARQILLRWAAPFAPVVLALAAASAGCVGMALARGVFSGQRALGWMSGNLFLAWVPLGFALAIRGLLDSPRVGRRGWRLAGCAAGWFFFFPNAPYLVTDLVHLKPRPPVPLWFDVLLLMAFASVGLLVGYVSLFLLEDAVARRRGARAGRGFALGMLALSSFGVYLGRFERWNSWDVLRHPMALLRNSLRTANPFAGPKALVFCAALTFFLVAGYAALGGLRRAGGGISAPDH